jgi:hypothetical protein
LRKVLAKYFIHQIAEKENFRKPFGTFSSQRKGLIRPAGLQLGWLTRRKARLAFEVG